MFTKPSLSTISTRQLLRWRDNCYKCGGVYCHYGDHNYNEGYALTEIKTELATREHIRNKREAQAHRRQQAKQKC